MSANSSLASAYSLQNTGLSGRSQVEADHCQTLGRLLDVTRALSIIPKPSLCNNVPHEISDARMEGSNLAQQILEIQRDPTLNDSEKAKKRQVLLSGKWAPPLGDTSSGVVMCMRNKLLSINYLLITLIFENLSVRGERQSSCSSGTACYV